MNNGWVKLYRKLADNEVMQDDKALRVFIWLLLHVDKTTGTWNTGRFQIGEALNINPSTVRDALYRLRDKYRIVNLTTHKATHKYTTVSLLNWAKYQANDLSNDTLPDNLTTIKRQSNDTKQEVRIKNREIIPLYSPLTDLDLQDIADKYRVPIGLVKLSRTKMDNWLLATGKTYKNYKAGLRNWVLREAQTYTERRQNDTKRVSIDEIPT